MSEDACTACGGLHSADLAAVDCLEAAVGILRSRLAQWEQAARNCNRNATAELAGLRAQLTEALTQGAALRALVDAQAEDNGLWFKAETAPEAYLQQELRKLHAAVERTFRS